MSATAGTLVDGHVHLHDGVEVADFLDSAAANFAAAARQVGLPAAPTGCLLLTESQGVDHFARLADGRAATASWRLQATASPCPWSGIGQARRRSSWSRAGRSSVARG